jgi:zinc protease
VTDDRAKAPDPGPPRPYQFPHVTRKTLANGARILIAETHAAPLVAVRALIRSGAEHDVTANAGLASLTAELLDEGAGSRDAIRLAEDLGRLGASIGSGADWDASYVSLDVLSRNASAALEIFADVVRRATLPPPSFERVRTERLSDLIQQRDEAGAIAGKRFSNLLYGAGTYGNSVVGNTESVSSLTPDDVRRYYETHYVPNNATIVVTGDINTADVIAQLERLFGDWKPKEEPKPQAIAPTPFEVSKVYLIDRPTAVQSEIRIGHLGVPRRCEDYFPLTVMNALLGGVFNSRINLNLREQHGYTYGARSTFAFRRQAGPFVVSAPVRNEVTLEAVNEVLLELRRIRTGDVEDVELDDTKNYLAGVFPATVQTAGDIAGRLLDMDLYDLPHDYFDHYRENIIAVGKEHVESVASKYIDPDRVLIVIVGNVAQIREPLGTLGLPIHDMDIDGNLLPVA